MDPHIDYGRIVFGLLAIVLVVFVGITMALRTMWRSHKSYRAGRNGRDVARHETPEND